MTRARFRWLSLILRTGSGLTTKKRLFFAAAGEHNFGALDLLEEICDNALCIFEHVVQADQIAVIVVLFLIQRRCLQLVLASSPLGLFSAEKQGRREGGEGRKQQVDYNI